MVFGLGFVLIKALPWASLAALLVCLVLVFVFVEEVVDAAK